MRRAAIAAGIAAALLPLAAAAQDKPCGKAEATAAEKAVERVVAWTQLHKAWQDYRHCDSGAVSESYTDALLRLTVEWKNVDTFAGAVQKDAQYKEWVYKRLKSPAAKDDQDAIYSRAKASCPPTLDAFCGEIAEAVKPAK